MSNNPNVVIGISATDTARQVLQGVDQKVAETAAKTDQAGDKMITKSQLMATQFKKNFSNILTSAAGLGAGIIGFATSFSDLDKAQATAQASTVALARAQDTLQSSQTTAQAAQVAYAKALDAYQKKLDSGKASASDLATAHDALAVKAQKLADAQDKLKTNQDNLTLATTKNKLAQDDLGDSYTNFYAQMPSQVLSFGVGATSVMNMLGISLVKNAASSAAQTAALQAQTVATGEATVATEGFRIATITAFITNPVGIAIIAVTTLIAALAFNVGGLRDRFNDFGKMLGDLIPWLKPVLEAIGSLQNLFGGASTKSDELTKATQDLADAQSKSKSDTDDFGSSISDVGDAVDSTKQKIMSLNDYLADQASKTADSTHENLLYVESTGKVKDALNLSSEELNRTAEYLRKQQRETEQTTQDNFNLVASTQGLEKALSLTDTQLNKVADSIRLQQKAAQDTAGAYDKMKDSVNAVKSALDALAEAQNRQVITQFGQQVGLGGTVSQQALINAGFGGNSDLMASAASGRLGGVFTPSGRVLDTGGTLYEDVIGLGTQTGTPHMLHAGEDIVPRSKSGGRGQPATIIFELDGKAIATAIVDDVTKLQGKRTRLQAKTYGQRFGVQK